MMKKILSIICVALALITSLSSMAKADPKFAGVIWWHDHWVNQDFNPYYDNGTDPQNGQWAGSNWTPADWIKSEGGNGEKLVQRWTHAGILSGSYKDRHGVSYLDIGPNFYHLSGYDKRRVTQTLDAIYQITTSKSGMYYIQDPLAHKIIGTYTKEGLTLE